MSVILAVAYVGYVLLSIAQLGTLLINDFVLGKVSWWTLIYPTVITGAVVMFNWEFSLLLSIYEEPAQMVVVWIAFILLTQFTYWSYAYYPKLRRNPFWRSNVGWH